jgi:hypothetical protein
MPRTRPYDPHQPLTPATWLSRRAFSQALEQELGIRVSAATLATKASRNAGPPYRVNLDGTVDYQWGPGSSWAEERLIYHQPAAADGAA